MNKFECPNCREKSISFWAKSCAGTLTPATCKKCGAKVCSNPAINGLFGTVSHLGYLYSAWLAFVQWSWTPLIIFLVIWLLLMFMIIRFAPLVLKMKLAILGMKITMTGFGIASLSVILFILNRDDIANYLALLGVLIIGIGILFDMFNIGKIKDNNSFV